MKEQLKSPESDITWAVSESARIRREIEEVIGPVSAPSRQIFDRDSDSIAVASGVSLEQFRILVELLPYEYRLEFLSGEVTKKKVCSFQYIYRTSILTQ